MTSNNPSNPNNPNRFTQPSGVNQKKSQQQNLLPVFITVGVILLGIIGFLAYNNIKKANQLEQTLYELEESNNLREELETQYNQALADLESQKTSNEELNAIIEQQKTELEAQKNKISGLIKSKGQLDRARVEIENLKTQVSGYMAQIDQLKAENELLAGENAQLLGEKEQLFSDLENKVAENQMLNDARAQLVSEKELLSGKVSIASVVKMREVTAVGQKVKGSGKAVDVKNAKGTDQVKVCFTTLGNDVVRPGMERFFVRIINPLGETLAIEDMGSGMITDKKTGEEIRFTKIEELEYSNQELQSCIIWAPINASFMKGDYTVEIYNKGYLSGMGAFSLK